MTEIVSVEYNEFITTIDTCEDVYSIVLDNSQVEVIIGDVIIKEVKEYVAEEDEVYDIEIDTSVAGVTYVGQAQPPPIR